MRLTGDGVRGVARTRDHTSDFEGMAECKLLGGTRSEATAGHSRGVGVKMSSLGKPRVLLQHLEETQMRTVGELQSGHFLILMAQPFPLVGGGMFRDPQCR